MPEQNQPHQQGQEQQQQQVRIDEEFPHPTMGHGHEVDLDDPTLPGSDFLPGSRSRASQG